MSPQQSTIMKTFRRWLSRSLKVLYVLVLLLLVTAAILYEPDLSLSVLKPRYTDKNSQFVAVKGMDVHYRIEGEGEPLVLVHGTSSMLQTWDGWTEALKKHFRVIRMDIPAFGLTGPSPDKGYKIEDYVDFLHQFTQAIGVDSFHLAGNSLGGHIAWRYALAHPTQVKKLVLVAPAGFVPKNGGSSTFRLARQYPLLMGLFTHIGTKYMVNKTLRDVYADDNKITEQTRLMYHDLTRRTGNRNAFMNRAKAYETESDDSILSGIQCPTLLLWGREDTFVLPSLNKHFRHIPKVDSVFFDNVGHVPQEEIPAQSAQQTLTFLQKH